MDWKALYMNEQANEKTKNPACLATMARIWMARCIWRESPTCCCGCGTELAISKDPKRQRLFCQGHDGRLHAFLAKVLRGEASRQDIPLAARANLARIGFIQRDRELQKAFANPGQQANRRHQKSAAIRTEGEA